jgi:hypothetical protein
LHGDSACSPCPSGTFLMNPAATSSSLCKTCPVGSASLAGSGRRDDCVSCSPGTSGEDPLVGCVDCVAGTCVLQPHQLFCAPLTLVARAGTRRAAASPAATPATPGQSRTSPAPVPPAPPAQAAPLRQRPEGTRCPPPLPDAPPRLTLARRRYTCIDCPSGTEGPGEGLSSRAACTSCPIGKAAESGSAGCLSCGDGWISNKLGSAKCTMCPGDSIEVDNEYCKDVSNSRASEASAKKN